MNDPFAMLDPMAKPKAPVGGGNAANYATTPMNFGQQPGIGYQQQQQPNANPFGGMSATGNPMMMNNNNHSSMHQQQMYPPQHNGAAFMTQPGPPSFSGLPPAPTQQMGVNTTHTNNPFMQPPSAPFQIQQANPFGASQPVMFAAQQDPFGTQMKPSPGGFAHPQLRPAEPTSHHHPTTMPAPLTHSSSIVMDFDPYSPRDNTPRSPFDLPVDHSGSSSSSSASASASALADRKRQTQEAQRSQLGFTSDAFATGSNPKISLKELATTTNSSSNNGGGNGTRVQSGSNAFGDAPFFTESNDDFMDQNMFANLDDDTPGQTKKDWNHFAQKRDRSDDDDSGGDIPRECGPHEYDVTFETGRKLGVLMERVDVWGAKRDDKRQEIAVVKLVVENGAADRVGVTTGSSVVAINGRSVAKDTYAIVLDMIKAAPRPMSIRFKRGTVNKDTTQGNVLTRISSKLTYLHTNDEELCVFVGSMRRRPNAFSLSLLCVAAEQMGRSVSGTSRVAMRAGRTSIPHSVAPKWTCCSSLCREQPTMR